MVKKLDVQDSHMLSVLYIVKFLRVYLVTFSVILNALPHSYGKIKNKDAPTHSTFQAVKELSWELCKPQLFNSARAWWTF